MAAGTLRIRTMKMPDDPTSEIEKVLEKVYNITIKPDRFLDLETGEVVDSWDKWVAFCERRGIDPNAKPSSNLLE